MKNSISTLSRAEAAASIGNSGLIEVAQRMRTAYQGYLWKVAVLGGLSVGSAIAESATVAMFVPLALAVSAGTKEEFEFDFGGMFAPISIHLSHLIIAAFVAILLRFCLQILAALIQARISSSYEASRRRGIINTYFNASWRLQSDERVGHLQNLATENIAIATRGLNYIATGMESICNFFVLLAAAFFVSPIAATSILVIAMGLFAIWKPLTRRARLNEFHRADMNAQFAGEVNQSVLMTREIRVFNARQPVEQHLSALIGRIRASRFVTTLIGNILTVVYQGLVLLLLVSAFAAAYYFKLENTAGIGAAAILLMRALTYSQGFQSNYHRAVETIPFAEQIDRYQRHYRSEETVSDGRPLEAFDELAFESVNFGYTSERLNLCDVSFTVRRGESIGIAGPSGGGKTTLIQLLLRLREPTSGRFLANGCEAGSYALRSWYDRIGIVPQEAHLQNDTVVNSIRFYRRQISQQQIELAAKKAGIFNDIVAWPDQFQTMVGEQGSRLSGGQRQRLCIARALAGNPDLIIFDEATSSLDVHSEAIILEMLNMLKGQTTTFVVAHRLSTLAACDRIMIIKNGCLDAFATTEELSQSHEYFQSALTLAHANPAGSRS